MILIREPFMVLSIVSAVFAVLVVIAILLWKSGARDPR